MTLYHRAADMLSRLHITHAERVAEVEPLIAELRAAAQQSALDELVRENERLGLYDDQRPVAWRRTDDHWEEYEYRDTNPEGMNGYTTEQRWEPLYAAPAPAQPRQPLSEWIKTSEQLPSDGGIVLGYWFPRAPGELKGSECYDIVAYWPGLWHAPDNDENDFRAPDYWRPLPAAPSSAQSQGKSRE